MSAQRLAETYSRFSPMWFGPGCNQSVSFSHNVVLRGAYSHLMWFQNRGCCRFEPLMFSVRYS